jgi:hypothetical protein
MVKSDVAYACVPDLATVTFLMISGVFSSPNFEPFDSPHLDVIRSVQISTDSGNWFKGVLICVASLRHVAPFLTEGLQLCCGRLASVSSLIPHAFHRLRSSLVRECSHTHLV